jgi:predicted dehydrogenase
MKEIVRVGMVGSKFAAGLHAESYKRLPHVKLVAVAAKDNLKEYGEKYGIAASDRYEDAADLFARKDIDLISVCVPNFLHKEIVLQAIAAGHKNIICEKPLATSLADGKAMVDAAEKNNVKLMYAEDWCFTPALVRAKELVDEGGIGKLLYVKAKEAHNGSHSIYAQKKEYCGGGALLHLAVHPVSWARWLVGAEVATVVGQVTPGTTGNLVHTNYTGEDWGAAILTFTNGVRAFVEGNYITTGGMDDFVEIYGSDGVIKVDVTFGSPLHVYSRKGIGYAIEKTDFTTGWTRPAVDEFASLGYCAEISAFVDCVRLDKPVPAGLSGEDGLAGLAIVLAAYQSSETGKAVDFAKFVKSIK